MEDRFGHQGEGDARRRKEEGRQPLEERLTAAVAAVVDVALAGGTVAVAEQ